MSLPFTFADQNLCAFFVSPTSAACSVSRIRLHFIILMLFYEAKFCSSPLSGFLRFGFRYSSLAAVLPNALCLLSSRNVRNQSSGPYKRVFMWGMERRDSEHFVFFTLVPKFLTLPTFRRIYWVSVFFRV